MNEEMENIGCIDCGKFGELDYTGLCIECVNNLQVEIFAKCNRAWRESCKAQGMTDEAIETLEKEIESKQAEQEAKCDACEWVDGKCHECLGIKYDRMS
jgi:hypothetical protein